MKRIIFTVLLLFTLAAAVTAYSRNISSELNHSIIRLHIIAQSDNDFDQKVKLAVRDRVLDATEGISAGNPTAFAAAAQTAANEYLSQNNIPYTAHAEFGSFPFPRKSYGSITLPAGTYRGIRVVLGSGSGQNWWCIMYPPLCVSGDNAHIAAQSKKKLKNSLEDDTYDLISSKPEIRFRVVELINSFKR